MIAQFLKMQNKLLQTRKKHTKGKRVKLDGVTVYSITKILKNAREKEAKKQTVNPKRPRSRPRKRPIEELEKNNEKEVLETLFSDSNIKITEGVTRRTRARKAE